MMKKTIDIPVEDGRFKAYVAAPDSGRQSGSGGHPGIVLIQEIFGVNRVMRDLADGFAAHGYVVACPDLFWRQEPGVELSDKSETEWARAFELLKGFDLDKGIADLAQTLVSLRALPECAGKAGAVGYCLGGQLAYLMACRTDVDAAISYYGVRIQDYLGEAAKIKKPTMLHVAAKDKFVLEPARKAILGALADHAQITIHVYDEMDHAFARTGGEHYDAQNAKLANDRSLAFFARHLG